MLELHVIEGDAIDIEGDALIACVDTSGRWIEGVNYAIKEVAANAFHSQVADARPLHDGQVIQATGSIKSRARFGDVVFVVDEHVQPLRKLLIRALLHADDLGYEHVVLPMVDRRPDVATESAAAVAAFRHLADKMRRLTVIVYANEVSRADLAASLGVD